MRSRGSGGTLTLSRASEEKPFARMFFASSAANDAAGPKSMFRAERADRDRDRWHARKQALHGGGDGARISDVVPHVRSAVYSRDDEVWLVLKEAEHREAHAIGRRPVGHERGLPGPELRRLHTQRAIEGDAVARAAPVAPGDDDVDGPDRPEGGRARPERIRFDAVVVRDQDVPAGPLPRQGPLPLGGHLPRAVIRALRARRCASLASASASR